MPDQPIIPSNPRPQRDAEPSLAHNLGAFFGHIVSAIRTPVEAPKTSPLNASPSNFSSSNPDASPSASSTAAKQTMSQPSPLAPSPQQTIEPLARREHVEREVQPDGSVVFRRTIVEEVRVAHPSTTQPPRDAT